ncbi:Gfo/Idh/MocA family protein [Puniceicoccus vermicola]|uniref:Gfo/Idh/MocA family oxidoreductase n=1 Tax=Puniceicoccus vermicola TaxID=388746 RepID=A0A7X1AZC9_9BACT|nr:Gfo/Idh/MocA family oxidoreductase [Puniceicoccus vermicola]MBC2602702.1 Gfo/Idh/MocA family oxidoreductase [Puniceicoccus vermicola]
MSDTDIRSAIIGLGSSEEGRGGVHSISYCHGWAHTATSGIELVGGCSRQQKNVDDFLAEFPGCEGDRNYRNMLEELKPDLVVICAFATTREEMVMAALENEAKAIWIEKPLALDLPTAKRIMKAAAEKGVRLFVSHQRRYGLPFEWFRDASSKVGIVQGGDIVQPMPNFLDFGPHLVDAALFALGESCSLRSVFGAVDWSETGEWHGIPHEKQLLGTAHFLDDFRITVEVGSDTPGKSPILRIHGSEGFAELHLSPPPGAASVFRASYAGEEAIRCPSTEENFHHGEDEALYMKRAVVDVVKALRSGGSTRIDVGEAYRGMEIIHGIYQSAKEGRALKADEL